MPTINCGFTFHWIKSVTAYAHNYAGAPLRLALSGSNEHDLPTELNLFLDDDVLTRRLVAAISDICAARRAEKAAELDKQPALVAAE